MTTSLSSAASAAQVVPVARYTYHLFSSRSEDDVVIYLYDSDGNAVARVFFPADDEPLPPASQTHGITALYFPRSRFAGILDMLRNEGPIELRWAGPSDSCLSTAFEPVGEVERVG
jgi:hypothetical protein